MAARNAADRTEQRIGSREATRVRGATGGAPAGDVGSRSLGARLLRAPGDRELQDPEGGPPERSRPPSGRQRLLAAFAPPRISLKATMNRPISSGVPTDTRRCSGIAVNGRGDGAVHGQIGATP